MAYVANLGTVSIPNGQQTSSFFGDRRTFGSCSEVVIFAPAALTGVVTLQAAAVEATVAQNSDARNVQFPNGTDFTIAAGKAVVIPIGAVECIRFSSSTNETAQRDFIVLGQFTNR